MKTSLLREMHALLGESAAADDDAAGPRDAKAKAAGVKTLDLGGLWVGMPKAELPADVRAKFQKGGASKKVLAEAPGAVIVLKLRIPARKSSLADEEPGKWADAEARMASEFELNLERTPLKTARAPKAAVKVTKVGFTGTYSTYALHATVEVSGAGVSSRDDDLVTAFDKRAERALDDMILAGGVAAETAFGETDWKHSEIDVM